MLRSVARRFRIGTFQRVRLCSTQTLKPAVALDIDGVLMRGREPIPQAKEAILMLRDNRIPFIFLTNDGHYTCEEKAKILENVLDVPISAGQVVVSHSPMQSLTTSFERSLIMACGDENSCAIARSYGFKKVVNVSQVATTIPHIWPRTQTLFHQASYPVSNGKPYSSPFKLDDIEAVFLLGDGVCWYAEMQLLCDILWDGKKQRPLFACNPDLTYSGVYHMPRLAGGAFKVAFSPVYKEVTGQELQCTQFGKPELVTYRFAEDLLSKLYGDNATKFTFFGIGDNPRADVRGANRAGWQSVLVRSGLYEGAASTALAGDDLPDLITDNVFEAVRTICAQQQETTTTTTLL